MTYGCAATDTDLISTNKNIKYEVSTNGYSFVKANEIYVNSSYKENFQKLTKTWDDLPLDKYMPDGAKFRLRRYGRFYFDSNHDNLIRLPHAPFIQTTSYNSYAGGIERWFEPFHEETFKNDFLLNLILFDYRQLPVPAHMIHGPWEITIQQIRIIAQDGMLGKPSPEGVHRDGFTFVVLHLMKRQNIEGGQSYICKDDKSIIEKCTLTKPLDSVYLDDRKIMHDVTPIVAKDSNQVGERDMLIINFDYQPELIQPNY